MAKLTFKLGYRPELDGVRGISILLVLCLHLIPALVPGGFIGVDIFFVLSGFLITSLLHEEWARKGSISLKNFYVRRVLRLGPALVVYLLALAGYALLFLRKESASEIYLGILLTFSYVSNWVIALYPGFPLSILAITWSLAVEEQFYFLWPLLLLATLRFKLPRRWIILGLLLAIVAVGVHRKLLWDAGAPVRRLYYGTDTHADGLLLGCLLGCLLSWDLIPKVKILRACLTGGAIVAAVFFAFLVLTTHRSNPMLYQGGFSLAALAITVMLADTLLWPTKLVTLILSFTPLVWLGRISYALYLWHWPVRGLIFGRSESPALKQILAAAVLSIAIAFLSYFLVERPFLLWKKRFSRA